MILHHTRGRDAEPALYYVRSMNRPDYSPQLDDKQLGVRGRAIRFTANVSRSCCAQLAEMYDPAVPFRQCEDADTCKFCDFRIICKRG